MNEPRARKAVWFDIENLTPATLDAFYDWQREASVYPLRGTTFSGPAPAGRHRVDPSRRVFKGAFYVDDADAVTAWLERHGVPITTAAPPLDIPT